jgi:hypothetical protein
MSPAASSALEAHLYRYWAKVYAREPHTLDDTSAALVLVFHRWIRERALPAVMLDVADYAHVPEGPGVILVCHEVSFALDASDGRLGLAAQRRRPGEGGTAGAVGVLAATLRQVREVADRLQREPSLEGRLRFDSSVVRVEINDRLWAPNTSDAFAAVAPLVQRAAATAFPGASPAVARLANDPRERLAVEITM